MLGKSSIFKSNGVCDDDSDDGKKKVEMAEMNEVAYSEIILSIELITGNGKIAFNLIQGCKTKEYVDGNVTMA